MRADDLFSSAGKSTMTCNDCCCTSVTEEKHDILTLPMSGDIKSSLHKFLSVEELTLENKWFCPVCNVHTASHKETTLVKCPTVLIFHLNRFLTNEGQVLKDDRNFRCFSESPSKDLLVTITNEHDVSFNNRYSLMASINHSGSINNGHYWAIIKDSKKNRWLSCNDRMVDIVDESTLNNKTCYILFFIRV